MQKIKAAISIILLIFVICFSFSEGTKYFADKKLIESGGEKVFLTLWHTDTFEGGKGSRADYLLSTAAAFEKEYKGVLIAVKSVEYSFLEENLKINGKPDLISYGNMGGISGLVGLNAGQNSLLVGDKYYGDVWCKGGYFLISKKEIEGKTIKNVIFSKGKYTEPVLAFALEGFLADSFKILPPIDAYREFILSKDAVLLGTQRDVYRLTSKNDGYYYYPLKSYNDLYQYISLFTTEKVKSFYAKKFIEFLVSEKGQKKLKKVAMMSYYNIAEQDIEYLTVSQAIKSRYTLSPFTDTNLLDAVNELSVSYLKGETEALKKIKTSLFNLDYNDRM